MPWCPGVLQVPQGRAQPHEPAVQGQQHPGVLCRVRRGLPMGQLCPVQPPWRAGQCPCSTSCCRTCLPFPWG